MQQHVGHGTDGLQVYVRQGFFDKATAMLPRHAAFSEHV